MHSINFNKKMKRCKYVVRYKPRKRSVKKRQVGGFFSFDPSKPFKGSRLSYLTKKFKNFARTGRRILRAGFG